MPQPQAPSVHDLTTLLNRRVLVNADERLTLTFEGLWLVALMEDLQALRDVPEDDEARARIHRLLTKGG